MQQSVINHEEINEENCFQVSGEEITKLDEVPLTSVVCRILEVFVILID